MKTNKTLIFFANPFGFGPTGKCSALISELKDIWAGKIVFAGSRYSFGLINQKNIIFEEINDRDIDQINTIIQKYENPHVISCLNRFAIISAHTLKVPNVIVDSLSWFWKQFPEGLLDADVYFAQKLPGINIEMPTRYSNKFVYVSAVIGTDKIPVIKNEKVLLHIGGGENPFSKRIQKNYLDLLAILVDNTKINNDIELFGGKRSIMYLKKKIKKHNVKMLCVEREEFLKKLAGSLRLITTPGLTASLEAMSFNIPLSFLLPTNLSQMANQKVFANAGIEANALLWSDFTDVSNEINSMTEKEGIPYIELLAGLILSDVTKLNKLQEEFDKVLKSSAISVGQKEFIKLMGDNGAKEIREKLQEVWNF